MKTIWKYEMKKGMKGLFIWALAVGGMGLFCILLFQSMADSIEGMADSFSQMGAFSDAFGMSTLSIASLKGFFATEVGTIHTLGSCMFAASIASIMLSKEEDGHTGEFTYTLPISRGKIMAAKYMALVTLCILFTVLCAGLYLMGIKIVGEEFPMSDFVHYMTSQFAMNIEVASICYLFSALLKKNKMGLGIGLSMMLYVYDLMARVVPDLSDTKFLTPFAYSNASEIFAGVAEPKEAILLGCIITVGTLIAAFEVYLNRDLAG